LLALVDPSPAVRQLAQFLLTDTLATKAPLLAYNHFLESLFVLNGCTAGLQAARQGGGAGAGGGGVAAGELPVMAGDEQGQYALPGPGHR
jgi:condensin-2 complex subunit D3